jgi:hypothetical protein
MEVHRLAEVNLLRNVISTSTQSSHKIKANIKLVGILEEVGVAVYTNRLFLNQHISEGEGEAIPVTVRAGP